MLMYWHSPYLLQYLNKILTHRQMQRANIKGKLKSIYHYQDKTTMPKAKRRLEFGKKTPECWICLCETIDVCVTTIKICDCPNDFAYAHQKCLEKWQAVCISRACQDIREMPPDIQHQQQHNHLKVIESEGSHSCRFCKSVYPIFA